MFLFGNAARGISFAKGLFHPAAAKITLVCCVLLDVGGITLLGNIVWLGMLRNIIAGWFGFTAGSLVAAIGGWDRRHATGHSMSLCDVK